MQRLFIAIDLPSNVRRLAEALQDRLRGLPVPVRWVHPARMHLTLVFLGEQPDERVGAVREAMLAAAEGRPGFTLHVEGTGCFGPVRRPRVVWLGLRAEPALEALQADLADRLREAGFTLEDRPFSPHLTLGRVRGPDPRGALTSALGSDKTTAFGSGPIDRIHLVRSILGPDGPSYTQLFHALLKRS